MSDHAVAGSAGGSDGTNRRRWAASAALWFYVAILAWSPFPLGSAVSWGAGLLAILVGLCSLIWTFADQGVLHIRWRLLAAPAILAMATLLWAVLQTVPLVPAGWAHPLWSMAGETLGRALPQVISIDPWRGWGEILKLGTDMAAFWLAFGLARDPRRAARLFGAVVAIAVFYALYAFALDLAGATQAGLLYALPLPRALTSGPFMLHNSFATYSGLAFAAALARLFALGRETIVGNRGLRRLALSLIHFLLHSGLPMLLAAAVLASALLASASRAGFAAALCGCAAMALAALATARGRDRLWALGGAAVAVAALLLLVNAGGDVLGARYGQLLDGGTGDALRLALWQASERMIADAPYFGLGLGTFQDAYPLYASQTFGYVMDKAHCDYLEFAAGLGLPAAIAWWSAMAWLLALCVRGLWIRRRNKFFALAAVGATVLVAAHSSVDFSLQIPAVALVYATLLGVGVAQSFSGGERQGPFG